MKPNLVILTQNDQQDLRPITQTNKIDVLPFKVQNVVIPSQQSE